ncbi:MAG: ABC transporter permease [Firmicutes bacterium]|nr:ABC transporter permease [Bacillota bacterium]
MTDPGRTTARPPVLRAGGPAAKGSRQTQYRLVQIVSIMMLLAVWEFSGRRFGSNLTFPPVSSVAVALAQRLVDPEFWGFLWTTLQALFVGLGLTIGVGIPLGLVAGRLTTVQRLINPYLNFFLSTPTSPLVPIFLIIFGIGLAPRVATVFIFAFPILVVNTITGVRAVPKSLLEMAASFGVSSGLVFRRIIFPASLPAIGAGLRLAAGRAVVGMVVAELIVISVGMGRLIQRYSSSFDSPNLFAVVIVVLAIGLLIVRGMAVLERRLGQWKQITNGSSR